MKNRTKEKKNETPQRLSYVETPLSTGQYPGFGIEHPEKLPPAERTEREKR